MSKIREQGFTFADELPPASDGMVGHYVVYTQKKEGAPHRYAGWLNAPDIDMATKYACEHYGQDESCVNIWVHDRTQMHETPVSDTPLSGEDTPDDPEAPAWAVFTQKRRGDIHVERGQVQVAGHEAALSAAISRFGSSMTQVRIVPRDSMASTEAGRVIWRTHDQGYRLAKGYSKSVRAKWDAFRKTEDIEEYRKDDIEHHF